MVSESVVVASYLSSQLVYSMNATWTLLISFKIDIHSYLDLDLLFFGQNITKSFYCKFHFYFEFSGRFRNHSA